MSRLKSKGSVQARQRTDCLPSNYKTLVHLRIDGPTAALADIPQVSELLTGVMAGADEVLAKAAVHLPAPALAAAGSLHIGVLHRVVVRRLFVLVERGVVVAHELVCQGRRDVVRIGRDL